MKLIFTRMSQLASRSSKLLIVIPSPLPTCFSLKSQNQVKKWCPTKEEYQPSSSEFWSIIIFSKWFKQGSRCYTGLWSLFFLLFLLGLAPTPLKQSALQGCLGRGYPRVWAWEAVEPVAWVTVWGIGSRCALSCQLPVWFHFLCYWPLWLFVLKEL